MKLENQKLRENVNDLQHENKLLIQLSADKRQDEGPSICQQRTFLDSSLATDPKQAYGADCQDGEIENILMHR